MRCGAVVWGTAVWSHSAALTTGDTCVANWRMRRDPQRLRELCCGELSVASERVCGGVSRALDCRPAGSPLTRSGPDVAQTQAISARRAAVLRPPLYMRPSQPSYELVYYSSAAPAELSETRSLERFPGSPGHQHGAPRPRWRYCCGHGLCAPHAAAPTGKFRPPPLCVSCISCGARARSCT